MNLSMYLGIPFLDGLVPRASEEPLTISVAVHRERRYRSRVAPKGFKRFASLRASSESKARSASKFS